MNPSALSSIVLSSCLILACGGEPAPAPAAAAAAPVAEAPAPAPDPSARLVGTWEEIQSFGGGDCASLDCAADVEPGRRWRVELRADGTYLETSEREGAPPIDGTWSAATAGEGITLSMTMGTGERAFPSDPQDIVFRDADTYERRNARSRHGGVWRRVPNP